MSDIKIEKISEEKKKELGIPENPHDAGEWSLWECEPSTFDWQYSDEELAYVYEGKVKVKADSEEVEITKGDFVTFPKGLSCQWQVLKKIKKVYRFR